MKLASYNDGSRDGQLVVVSRDLTAAHYATGIATRLQQVLDDWNFLSPQLQALSQNLNHGKSRHAFAFDPGRCLSPLPRAFQWIDVCGFDDAPDIEGAMRRGASDSFLAPRSEFACDDSRQVDVEPRLAVVVGDVGADITPGSALDSVRLAMLAGDLVHRIDGGRPATAFSPVAVTPDELAPGWQAGRICFELEVFWNGRRFGACDAGPGMRANFGQLIAATAARRGVAAGSIVGSGPIGRSGAPHEFLCVADRRARELADSGEATTPFARPGDTISIAMKGADGQSLFGTIDLRAVGDRTDAQAGETPLAVRPTPD